MKDLFYKVLDKWENVCDGEIERMGDDCAFCKTYEYCVGCPIQLDTDYDDCYDTPYQMWRASTKKSKNHKHRKVDSDKSQRAADDMLEYLNCLFERWIEEDLI